MVVGWVWVHVPFHDALLRFLSVCVMNSCDNKKRKSTLARV
jgi:hypothetical protein